MVLILLQALLFFSSLEIVLYRLSRIASERERERECVCVCVKSRKIHKSNISLRKQSFFSHIKLSFHSDSIILNTLCPINLYKITNEYYIFKLIQKLFVLPLL
jgi:hypothetical protein